MAPHILLCFMSSQDSLLLSYYSSIYISYAWLLTLLLDTWEANSFSSTVTNEAGRTKGSPLIFSIFSLFGDVKELVKRGQISDVIQFLRRKQQTVWVRLYTHAAKSTSHFQLPDQKKSTKLIYSAQSAQGWGLPPAFQSKTSTVKQPFAHKCPLKQTNNQPRKPRAFSTEVQHSWAPTATQPLTSDDFRLMYFR